MYFDACAAKALKLGEDIVVQGCPGLRLEVSATRKTWTYRYGDGLGATASAAREMADAHDPVPKNAHPALRPGGRCRWRGPMNEKGPASCEAAGPGGKCRCLEACLGSQRGREEKAQARRKLIEVSMPRPCSGQHEREVKGRGLQLQS